jgi:hypothetical protein
MNASDILNRITKFRRSQTDFVRFLIGRDELLGQKVRGCGSFLHMREWVKHEVSHLINANFCKKHLLCPACAWRRSLKLVARYTQKAEAIQKERPELIPMMITLGVVNGPDLAERVGHLKACWKAMGAAARKAASKTGCKHGNALIEMNKLAGSIRAIEITNKGKGWHAHMHIFALATDYIDREKLSAEWERFTGDSFIVDVRKCKNGIIAGMCEVLKYALKPGELSNEQVLHVHETLGGSRLLDPAGILRGVLEGDIDQDDLPELDGPTRDLIACWLWGEQKFHLRELSPVATFTQDDEKIFAQAPRTETKLFCGRCGRPGEWEIAPEAEPVCRNCAALEQFTVPGQHQNKA